MSRLRSRMTLGVVSVVVAATAFAVIPGAGAQVVTPTSVRTVDGTLRLHMGTTGSPLDFFRWEPVGGPNIQQAITGGCPVTGPAGAGAVAALTAGKIGSSFSLNQVGLKNHTLGIKFLNCGAIDATNWEFRLALGAPTGVDADTAADYADIDLRGSSGAIAVVTFLRSGSVVGTAEVTIPSSKVTRLQFGDLDPETQNPLFDQIRLRPKKAFTSVALGGGSATTADTTFRVVTETPFEAALCPGDELTTGAGDDFVATVTNVATGPSECDDPAPVSLTTTAGEVEDTALLEKGESANDVQLTLHVEWPDAPAPDTGRTPASQVQYGNGPIHDISGVDGSGWIPDAPRGRVLVPHQAGHRPSTATAPSRRTRTSSGSETPSSRGTGSSRLSRGGRSGDPDDAEVREQGLGVVAERTAPRGSSGHRSAMARSVHARSNAEPSSSARRRLSCMAARRPRRIAEPRHGLAPHALEHRAAAPSAPTSASAAASASSASSVEDRRLREPRRGLLRLAVGRLRVEERARFREQRLSLVVVGRTAPTARPR